MKQEGNEAGGRRAAGGERAAEWMSDVAAYLLYVEASNDSSCSEAVKMSREICVRAQVFKQTHLLT